MQGFFGSREDYEQVLAGRKCLSGDDCPFCAKNIQEERILWQGAYWRIVHNRFPYSGTSQHLLVVPKKHILFSSQISAEGFAELTEVHRFMREFFGDTEYFSCTRESIGNRSVEHLHIHFIPGVLKGKFLRKMLELQGFPIKQTLTF